MVEPYSYADRAAATRRKAELTTSPQVKASLERVAVTYDRLAEQETRLNARRRDREPFYRSMLYPFLPPHP